MKLHHIIFFLLICLAACVPFSKGGKVSRTTTTKNGATTTKDTFQSPENASAGSTRTDSMTNRLSIKIPEGSLVRTETPSGPVVQITPSKATELVSDTGRVEAIGLAAAHVDDSRVVRAKLASAHWIQALGVLFLLAGVATFHPVVKAFVMSKTVTMGLFAVGAGLCFLPYILIGHEAMFGWFAGAALLGGLAYFFIHRHGQTKGKAETLEKLLPKPEPEATK